MSRRPLLTANWKMHKTAAQAIHLINEMKECLLKYTAQVDIVLCPPFTALSAAKEALKESGVALGAQNIYLAEQGAYTGEVSAEMVKEWADYVIIGHSERRRLLGESDGHIRQKIETALRFGLKVIMCVGEDLTTRQTGSAETFVCRQLREGLADINDCSSVTVAYEPLWAIGSGQAASPQDAQAMAAVIREQLSALFGSQAASGMRILYGGSVNAANIASFMQQKDIDGALIGTASLQAAAFLEIVREAV